MREIVFRGKKIDNGEWIKGTVLNGLTKTYIVYDKAIYHTMLAKSVLTADRYFEIYPETIGQYTGLKDKNGKMIFEGDIIKTKAETFIVKYGLCRPVPFKYWTEHIKEDFYLTSDELLNNSKCVSFYAESDGGQFQCFLIEPCVAKVIGNVFDNPELLKEQL